MFTNFKSLLDESFICRTNNETCIEHRQPPKSIHFSDNEARTVLRGNCLNHLDNCIIYNGMDTQTGDLFAIKEWIVYGINTKQKEKILEHLSVLVRLEHQNLTKLKNFTYEHVPAENKWIFYILQEFIFGANCLSLFLIKNFRIPIDVLRHIANGILNSLDFLCKNSIMCPNIMDTFIYINDNGDIKLINYEINENVTSSVRMQIEFNNENTYNFGILLLSLIRGEVVNPNFAEIPETVPPILHDFLARCVTNNNITDLLNHSFIQTSCDFVSCVEVPDTPKILSRPEVLEQTKSRVESDFEILELLGEGGFGRVYKAQKILDGQTYALKKIKLDPNNEKLNDKLIREVQYLSRLNHENVVRYYNSWTDVENSTNSDEETDSSDGSRVKTSTGEENYSSSKDNNSSELCDSRILYIQMEFYEGKTLKHVIESNELHWDISRISKFLREMVEGLAYIHEELIIHRDLKPLNIFLDSNDHVKIGDFGLATTNTRYKRSIDKYNQNNENANKEKNGSSTSRVGTGLYKAPELSSNVRICDQTLDMYSLGIILFEMCYERFNTDSERIAVLMNLRLKEIKFPKNFNQLHSQRQTIIRKLLNHNPLERPTSHELLENKCIPPILEEKKQQEVFRFIIENPHLKLYKHLMKVCFHQTSYNYNYNNSMFEYKNITNLDPITNILTEIFKLHGGQNLRMSAVMPQNSCNDDCQNCIKLMTRTGSLVSIPCNNRIAFARYVAMNTDLTWFRRFSIEKTKMPTRFLEDVYECVFDIIAPISPQNVVLDAEILKIINEIKDSFPDLKPNSFRINLNHSLLIKAIFLECGFPECDVVLSKDSLLYGNLQDDMISKLGPLTTFSYSVTHTEILQLFTNIEARNMANTAMEELSQIVKTAIMLGVTCPIRITPGLMNNFKQHSGMLVELKYYSRNNQHVLAAGGRYDTIIDKFRTSTSIPENNQVFKYGVGISVNLESLYDLLQRKICGKNCDVVVCSFGEKTLSHEEIKILRELWSARISCSFINVPTRELLQNWCKKYNVLWAVLLSMDDIDRGLVTLVKWKRHGNMNEERKINIRQVINVLTNSAQSLRVKKPTVKGQRFRTRTQADASCNTGNSSSSSNINYNSNYMP